MNAIDKVIGYFSPERAYRRAQYRAATEVFAYDGAKSGRRTEGWIAAGGDANTEVGTSLVALRNRSRDLLRNNPYATKAIAELVGNTVGTGIVPQAKTGNPALDAIIDAEWPYLAENCDPGGQLDFYGMQSLIVRTTAESGDGVVRFRGRLPQDNFRIPLQLQVLEGARASWRAVRSARGLRGLTERSCASGHEAAHRGPPSEHVRERYRRRPVG
jgi:capsid protein